MFDFPRKGEREYIAAIDIAAVITVRDDDYYTLTTKATRDIEQTFNALWRLHHPNPVKIVSVFWVRNLDVAKRVAQEASCDPGPWLGALIDVEAKRLGSAAVPHAVVMDRIRAAGAQIDNALAHANARGDLAWFNKAYRTYRDSTPSAMSYPSARKRLRSAVVRGMVMGGKIDFSAGMLTEVFGDAVKTQKAKGDEVKTRIVA